MTEGSNRTDLSLRGREDLDRIEEEVRSVSVDIGVRGFAKGVGAEGTDIGVRRPDDGPDEERPLDRERELGDEDLPGRILGVAPDGGRGWS